MTEDELRKLTESRADDIAHVIVADWRAQAQTETWLSLPPQMDFNDLPNVIRAIVTAALRETFVEEDCRRILELSARHGDHRSIEGFQESYIHTEYYLLRQSLWREVRQLVDQALSLRVITRIDAAITLATMAALRGFHCRTFEQRGQWPAARDRLLEDWPLIGQ